MNRKIKRLFIFMIIAATAVIVNYTRASDKNPGKVNGDCSDCLNDPEYLSYFSQAESGSMIATYQASARLIQCYIENRCYGNSSGYSYQDLVNMLEQNQQTIRDLQGEQPYIKLPDSYSDDESNSNDDNNYNNSSDDGDGRITVRSAK